MRYFANWKSQASVSFYKWSCSPGRAAPEGFRSVRAQVRSGRCGRCACWPWWLDLKKASAAVVTSSQGAFVGRGRHQTPRRAGLGDPRPPFPARCCCCHRLLLQESFHSCPDTRPGAGETAAAGRQDPDTTRPTCRRPQRTGSLRVCAPGCAGLCRAPPAFHVALHVLAAVLHSSLFYLIRVDKNTAIRLFRV